MVTSDASILGDVNPLADRRVLVARLAEHGLVDLQVRDLEMTAQSYITVLLAGSSQSVVHSDICAR